jgi:hypothetical protein
VPISNRHAALGSRARHADHDGERRLAHR